MRTRPRPSIFSIRASKAPQCGRSIGNPQTDEAELRLVDPSGKQPFHDDRITQGGGRRLGLGRIGDDPLRDGRDAAGPEDLFGEMFVKGSRRRIEKCLKSGGSIVRRFLIPAMTVPAGGVRRGPRPGIPRRGRFP